MKPTSTTSTQTDPLLQARELLAEVSTWRRNRNLSSLDPLARLVLEVSLLPLDLRRALLLWRHARHERKYARALARWREWM